MWNKPLKQEKESLFLKAREFTGDHELYGSWMLKVLDSWPIACEHNLTDTGMNRLAWIGHAAASLALNLPEMVVREAWFTLTENQRDKANEKALKAVKEWERRHFENQNKQLDLNLAETGI